MGSTAGQAGSGTRRSLNARGAFTLIELMLVLALLLIVATAAMPLLSGTLASRELAAAGEEIRVAWGRARVQAMRSGATYVFTFQPGTGSYRVDRWHGFGVDETNLADAEEETTPGFGPAAAPLENEPLTEFAADAQNLPDDVVFYIAETEESTRSAYLQADAAAAESEWSKPIFFYPDGTTSSARVILGNSQEQFVSVSLRGLTGVVKVSEFLTEDELVGGAVQP